MNIEVWEKRETECLKVPMQFGYFLQVFLTHIITDSLQYSGGNFRVNEIAGSNLYADACQHAEEHHRYS